MALVNLSITVQAYGRYAKGSWPHFDLLIDGEEVGGTYVTSSDSQEYRFEVEVPANQAHRIGIRYDNDFRAGPHDRNLFVETIKVGDTLMRPTDPGVVYDKGALDGLNVVAGRVKMPVNGTLLFDFDAETFAAPAPVEPEPTPAEPEPTPVEPEPTPDPAPAAPEAGAPEADIPRGLWVWRSYDVLSDPAEAARLVETCQNTDITDVYLFLRAEDYASRQDEIAALNGELAKAGVKVWGMEGWRGYFSDAYGPDKLYAAADALVEFNRNAPTEARFAGFHSDMEPQDGQGEGRALFHNGKAGSELSSTEAAERETLMQDWLTIQATLDRKMEAAGLKFGAATPSWTDDYYGEPVLATFEGTRKGVMEHLMDMVDDYIVMSYNTDPANAANRVVGELAYADTLGDGAPRVFAAVETHDGPGATVSYGDHPTKASKDAVLADMEAIRAKLDGYSSFAGVNIHDYEGWTALPDTTLASAQ